MRSASFSAALLSILLGLTDPTSSLGGHASQRSGDSKAANPTRTATIKGTVVAAESNEPVELAKVTLLAGSKAVAGALTNENGQYEMRDLPAGRYLLTFDKTGFVLARYGQRYPLDDAKGIELRRGQSLDRVDAMLWRATAIEGRVYDEKGAPITDAIVSARRVTFARGERRLAPIGTVRTDRNGDYRLSGLQEGDYYLSASVAMSASFTVSSGKQKASREEFGYPVVFYPGVPDPSAALPITVRPGMDVSSIDITMRRVRLARVSGTVTTSSGRFLDGAHVALKPSRGLGLDPSTSFTGVGRVGRDGSFAIARVPAGSYVLEARSIPKAVVDEIARTGKSAPLVGSAGSEFAAMPITLSGEDVSDIALITSPVGRIVGSVTVDSKPLNPIEHDGIVVIADPAASDAFAAGATETVLSGNGRFEIRGVVGRFVLRVRKLPPGLTLKGVESRGGDVTDTGVDVGAGEDLSGTRVILTSRPTALTGHVTAADSDPREYSVIAFSEDPQRWSWPATRFLATARVDIGGGFRVIGLPPGKYWLVAVTTSDPERLLDPQNLARLSRGASRIELQEGGRQTVTLRGRPN